jgi:hypothetical protein
MCFRTRNMLPAHTWIMCSHCVFNSQSHIFWMFMFIWTLGLDAVQSKRDILLVPTHTWIMRSHGVLISHFIVLLVILPSSKPLGRLAFSWCFVCLFFLYCLQFCSAFTMSDEGGAPSLAGVGHSPMREWQLTPTLGEVRRLCVVVCTLTYSGRFKATDRPNRILLLDAIDRRSFFKAVIPRHERRFGWTVTNTHAWIGQTRPATEPQHRVIMIMWGRGRSSCYPRHY